MPPIMYQIAGGLFFLPGAGLVAIAVMLGMASPKKWISILKLVLAVLGIAMIATSATALPWWLYIAWAVAIVGWIFGGFLTPNLRMVFRAALLCITITASAIEISYRRLPPLSHGHYSTLYVIGDSISAGLDRRGEKTWPKLIREDQQIQVVDLSRAGCTTSQALRIAQTHFIGTGVVVIEIGGNDLIGKTDPNQFGVYLDQLIQSVRSNNRTVVMFELPLFPFDNAYGVEQRRVAHRYGVTLIPRRCMADILASPGTTTDGIHFTNAGQRKLAELVWNVISAAMEPNPGVAASAATGGR